jgi:hypothetical protein
MPVAQQQCFELLACLQPRPHSVLSGARQIAQRLIALIGNRNVDQFPGPCRTREQQRVAPIVLIRSPGRRAILAGAITSRGLPRERNCRASV